MRPEPDLVAGDGVDFNDFDAALWETFGGALLAATLEAAFGASFSELLSKPWLISLQAPCGLWPRAPWPTLSSRHGRPSRSVLQACWRISCAFSWTYAFLSSLSAAQPIGYCGSRPGRSDSRRLLGKSDGPGVWLQAIRRYPISSLKGPANEHLGLTASNSINRGLAAMPAQERSIEIDGRALCGDQPQRRHREAMARNTSPPPRQESRQASLTGSNPQAQPQIPEWDDDAPWDQDEAAAGHRARRLLSGSDSTLHRFSDQVAAAQRWVR